ncbi:MFS transporter [Ramlibacter tataouinensis]|uniref:Candidate membrane protein, related to efflux protein n=1 Tax=Ramlibacter tataouinensis (strain ATCC BAA-407 / DSM 14655 / LMG 21543 / TTB310) TaxID=365046 RepID=F5Y1L2_RAMTT|nr:MFS transporter [Ramlibacter tataouinensis]AEG92263.1 candidate membrane protein, related to efflux protein [Ramlibacter tataouinensis TTB310]
MPAVLYLFALTNLVIGTGAFVLSGILQPLAASLGVRVAAAGQVMTAYALASALLAPLILLATGRWPRKRAVLLALALFAAGCAACASAGSLTTLLLGRVLMGAGSVFTALAAGVAVAVVPPERRGRALSLTFLGMSLSYAFGVPLGTWLGLAHSWQVPVWGVAGACVAVGALLMLLLPARIGAPGASFRGLGQAARDPAILRVWLRTLLYFIAIFSVFAYAGPVLLALNPLTPAQLSLTLVLFGLSGVAGTLSGGWAGDRFGPIRTLRVQLLVLAAMMVLVPLTRGHPVATVVVFVVWGVAGFGMMSPQQVLLAQRWPEQAPLLMSLNGSMLYVGTALGAALSGAFVDVLGFHRLAWVGLPFALLALVTLWFDAAQPARRPASAEA